MVFTNFYFCKYAIYRKSRDIFLQKIIWRHENHYVLRFFLILNIKFKQLQKLISYTLTLCFDYIRIIHDCSTCLKIIAKLPLLISFYFTIVIAMTCGILNRFVRLNLSCIIAVHSGKVKERHHCKSIRLLNITKFNVENP
jgi:hypothetical protein